MATKKHNPRVQFYCPPNLLAFLNKQARKFCGGNRSEYLRHLVLNDLKGLDMRMNTPSHNPLTFSPRAHESETQRQQRLDKARKQAIAQDNPAVAHALGSSHFHAMQQELKGALKIHHQKHKVE